MWIGDRLAAASWLTQSASLGRLARHAIRLVPRWLPVPIPSGPLRGAWWIVGAGNRGHWLGTYEPKQARAFVTHVRPGAVVLDLGAHAGWYTLLAARLVGPTGRVVAIEPEPTNLRYLRRHLWLNRCAQATVIEAAVTDREGQVWLDDGVWASNSVSWRVAPTGRLSVRSVAIDPLISAGTIPTPDIVKMDVEGAEGAVLRWRPRSRRCTAHDLVRIHAWG